MESKEFLIDLIFPVSNKIKDQEYRGAEGLNAAAV